MEFTIKLERFEGPYTKLIDLISDHKLSITEISLAKIADEYIAYVKELEKENAVDLSQFIVVASTLMLIKARSLLPQFTYTKEEEKQVTQLEKKLELYASLRKACALINKKYLQTPLYARKPSSPKGVVTFVPSESVHLSILHSIAVLTLSSFAKVEKLKHIYVEQAVRIETVIENILERVQKAASLSLSSLAGSAKTFAEKKKVLIVSFLALLELVKNGSVQAEQGDGGDILISEQDLTNPSGIL